MLPLRLDEIVGASELKEWRKRVAAFLAKFVSSEIFKGWIY